MLEDLKENVEEIQDNTKAYIESNIAYYKLLGFKVAMKTTTLIFKFALIGICLMFVLFFASVAGAFAIGKALDSNILGFLSIAGVYLLLVLFLFLVKDKIKEAPIMEKFSEIFFNED